MRFGRAPFILDGVGQPKTVFAPEGHAVRSAVKFHHVALPCDPKPMRDHREPAQDQRVSPAFPLGFVVGALVEEGSLHRAQIFLPLVFHVDQGPLTAAEGKVLQAGELEEILFRIGHPMRVTVTPAGRPASSTVTV